MSLYVFYSDLHVRPERIEDCEIVLKAVGEIALDQKRKGKDVVIVNGGDTFNTRGLIKTSCFDVLYSHYEKWASQGLTQIIIVGNHDQEDKEGKIHPMRVFEQFEGWVVVDKPTVVGDMAFFPYMNKSSIPSEIKKAIRGGAKDATVHWGIQGAMMNEGHEDSDGVPAMWLADFNKVFSGHYHYRNSFQNIQYIGSPMQQSFGEINQKKGVLLYDNETNEVSFKEISGTSCHYEVEVCQDSEEKRGFRESFKGGNEKEVSKKDFIRVKVKGDSEFCSSINKSKYSERYGVASVKVERDVKDRHVSRLKITSTDILSTESIMQKYVDFVETSLDKTKLMKIGRGLL
jgi:DNA repair exonuclease SbcCD nuclease subunit